MYTRTEELLIRLGEGLRRENLVKEEEDTLRKTFGPNWAELSLDDMWQMLEKD